MATECNQEEVLYFIKERGGRVKSEDLMKYFRAAIPNDPALKHASKEAFKRYVDSVAYVKEENGEKYVCLKKKFRKPSGSNEKRKSPTEERKPGDLRREGAGGGEEGMLPGSGYTTGNAGGAQSQPDISVRYSESGRGRTESELMGNTSSTAEDKPAENMRRNQAQVAEKAPRPLQRTLTTHGAEGKVESQEECGKENRPRQIDDLTDDSTSSTPQARRRYRDCPRVDSDCEAAAAATLEPLEHEWMMCASDGHWEILRRLLLTDPSLLTRKDFVTGFTCLHWAAKLGKHELIVMLLNFAKEHRVAVNVNARSSAGYTPLHLAAMHSHLEVLKLLVGAFDADVEARDYSGRKACQYLKSGIAQNILDIAGACVESDADGGDAEDASRWRLSRVIQTNFRPLKTQNIAEEDGGGLTKQRSLRRKSSFTKMKPSLNKIRMRSQIVHSTSLLDRFEKDPTEESPNLLRPKSNLFG